MAFAVDATGVVVVWWVGNPERGFFRYAGDHVTHHPIPEAHQAAWTYLAPFADGRLLVDVYEPNPSLGDAAIYAPTGEKLTTFRSPEGLGRAQITASGQIWVPYSDQSAEGMLDCFDTAGRLLFRYYPFYVENDLPPIVDCYALNVIDDHEVWAYYYADFPLVRLRDFLLAGHWDAAQVPYSRAFAVDGERVLFAGRYPPVDEQEPGRALTETRRQTLLYLLTLATGTVERLQVTAHSGDDASSASPVKFFIDDCLGRGSCLYLSDGCDIHVVDLVQL